MEIRSYDGNVESGRFVGRGTEAFPANDRLLVRTCDTVSALFLEATDT